MNVYHFETGFSSRFPTGFLHVDRMSLGDLSQWKNWTLLGYLVEVGCTNPLTGMSNYIDIIWYKYTSFF